MSNTDQIRALEESLNVTLFHRHARGLILTEQGELLFDATQAMAKRLDATAARIRDSFSAAGGAARTGISSSESESSSRDRTAGRARFEARAGAGSSAAGRAAFCD